MNFLMDITLVVGIISLCFMFVISLALTIFMLVKKPGSTVKKYKVDEAFIKSIIENFGGIENIADVVVDNNSGRLRVKVKNLEIVKLENLKAISQKGVFVTNDVVVTLFKYDSIAIKTAIKSQM